MDGLNGTQAETPHVEETTPPPARPQEAVAGMVVAELAGQLAARRAEAAMRSFPSGNGHEIPGLAREYAVLHVLHQEASASKTAGTATLLAKLACQAKASLEVDCDNRRRGGVINSDCSRAVLEAVEGAVEEARQAEDPAAMLKRLERGGSGRAV